MDLVYMYMYMYVKIVKGCCNYVTMGRPKITPLHIEHSTAQLSSKEIHNTVNSM